MLNSIQNQRFLPSFRQVLQAGKRGRGEEGTGGALKLLVNYFPQLLKSWEIVIKVEKAILRKLNSMKKIVIVFHIPA